MSSDGELRTDLRLREVSEYFSALRSAPGLKMASGQQIDDLKVECVNPRCKWEGRRGDHAAHKAAGCPVRADGTPRGLKSWLLPSTNRTSTIDGREFTPSISAVRYWPTFMLVMTIFIKTLEGHSLTFQVKPTETVDKLKKLVQERQGIAPDLQRLLFGGKQLEDGKTLKDYNIGPDATGQLSE
jgi:ubiquitin-large subunit ribosomal protein L40e